MSGCVRIERDADVAVVVIDNPPVNAASLDVRGGLLAAIDETRDDARIAAIVLIGAGRTFVAGADLREFDQPPTDPQLPAVVAAIEGCGKPVVAALHGAALGGGFELALGCDARVALAGTVVGLPEVTLGIIPGAGGTQRLPRLAGIARAIAMIAGAERVQAEVARELGLVDRVVASELRSEAIAMARAAHGKRRVRDLAVPACDEASIAAAVEGGLRSGNNRTAVQAAIDSILAARRLPFDEALAQERRSFLALRGSSEARALRDRFFAERERRKARERGDATSR